MLDNTITDTYWSYKSKVAVTPWFTGHKVTDLYLPKLTVICGGKDPGNNDYHSWFCGNGYWRKYIGNTGTPAYDVIYLRDVTNVGTGAFCGVDIVNLVINSDVVPTVSQLPYGFYTSNGKLFEGSHTIQHIWVKDSLVNDFKNDTYWGEKASIIGPISDCPRATEADVRAGTAVGLINAWM